MQTDEPAEPAEPDSQTPTPDTTPDTTAATPPGPPAARRLERVLTIVAWSLPAAVAVIALLTVGRYGISWDEIVQAEYGEQVLAFFRSGGSDQRCLNYYNLRFYGPIFELAAAWLYDHWPQHKWWIRHAMIALTGVGGLWAVAWAGRAWRLAGVSAFAVLALVMQPRWYGHMFMNSKDIPFAVAFTLTMAAVLHGVGRDLSWRRSAVIGLLAGLTLATRIGGVLAVAFICGIGVFVLARRWWLGQLARDRAWWLRLAGHCAMAGAIAWIVMIAVWPYAILEPIRGPVEAFRIANAFPQEQGVMFGGQLYSSLHLPRFYMPRMYLLVTPLIVLALALIGLVAIAVDARRAPRDVGRVRDAGLLLWLFFPVLYVVISRPALYDGVRHFLFLMPPLALLAGRGAAWLLSLAHCPYRRSGVAAVIGLLLLMPVPAMLRLHPYQYVYFNPTAGDAKAVQMRYDTDYWILSYRDAFDWLNEQADRQPQHQLHVAVAANVHVYELVQQYARPNITFHIAWDPNDLPPAESFHYFVGMARYGKAGFYPAQAIVHTAGPEGYFFTVIRRGARPFAAPTGSAPAAPPDGQGQITPPNRDEATDSEPPPVE